ncbi:MAG: DUF642 domain-containing protein [Saprospiraceae bacterium]|nr:DUF642 domain-containing protein [Saprospiraceae bacterium]
MASLSKARTWIKYLSIFLFFSFFIFPQKAKSVVDPEIILWKTNDYATFINSAFQGVLGRAPHQQEFIAWMELSIASKKNKADLFWKLVGSTEYRSRFGHLKKEYYVYWDTERKETDYGVTLCHCYYSSKHDYVFMPTLQYLGIPSPTGPFNFGVGAAVRNMYAAFDKNTCTLYNCGYRGEGSGDLSSAGNSYEDCLKKYCPGCENSITLLGISTFPECNTCMEQYKAEIESCQNGQVTANVVNNLVSDPYFASFGMSQSKWLHGNQYWGNSGYNQSIAQRVDLPGGSRPSDDITTALMIQNYSDRGPQVYGTTMQKIPVAKGKTYKISLWAAAENLASHSGLLISVDAQWKVRPIRLNQGSYGWTEYRGEFTANSNYVHLRILSEDRGKVFLTGITLSEDYNY